MDEPDDQSHGCKIEAKTTEYVVHAVHLKGFTFEQFTWDVLKRNIAKKDCLIPVDAHERGAGKSRFTQHYIRTELWPSMFEYGLVTQPEWDWAQGTVFYDSDEYQAKYMAKHDGWAILTDDEAWSKMMARNSMRGTQKETMECFGIGRFLKTNAFMMTPGYLEIDRIVRNTVATHWLHIAHSSEYGATICILKKCEHQHWPLGRAFWDCLGHIKYPYTFPRDWDNEFEAAKLAAYERYMTAHSDYKAKRIERLRKQEEFLAKKLEDKIARKSSNESQKRERSSKRERKDDSEGSLGIADLENLHTGTEASPDLSED